MRKRRNISSERLRELISYDEATGAFTWLARPGVDRETKRWNARYAGKKAGVLHASSGYHRVCVDSVVYQSHRLAWFYVNGKWPAHMVDHVDGDCTNNAIANLREATMQQNQANRGAQSNNRTGVKGVTRPIRSPKWLARIKVEGRDFYLGRFDTKEEASAAYHQAAKTMFGSFARSK